MRADLGILKHTAITEFHTGGNSYAMVPPKELAMLMSELKLLRELASVVTEYLNHSGRSKTAWMSADTLRQTVQRIKREIENA